LQLSKIITLCVVELPTNATFDAIIQLLNTIDEPLILFILIDALSRPKPSITQLLNNKLILLLLLIKIGVTKLEEPFIFKF